MFENMGEKGLFVVIFNFLQYPAVWLKVCTLGGAYRMELHTLKFPYLTTRCECD